MTDLKRIREDGKEAARQGKPPLPPKAFDMPEAYQAYTDGFNSIKRPNICFVFDGFNPVPIAGSGCSW